MEPTKAPPAIVSENSVTMLIGTKLYAAQSDHPNYSRILTALRDRQYDGIDALFDIPKAIEIAITDHGIANGEFTVESGIIALNGEPFTIEVSHKVLRMIEGGYPIEPLRAFLRKVRQNPSARVQSDLLLFAVANGFTIHEDGDIVAWKGVNGDYTDQHSGTVLNKPAHLIDGTEQFTLPYTSDNGDRVAIENGVTVVSKPRHQVDDRHGVTCSFGLHVGSFSYANGYGQRQIAVKVNPADFVSVPEEYGNGKARVSRYEVLTEMEGRVQPEHKEVYTDTDFGVTSSEEDDEDDINLDADLAEDEDALDDDLDEDEDALDEDEDEDSPYDKLVDAVEDALLDGEITSKAEFGAFVGAKGYSISDANVRTAIDDAGLGRWLD
jgi:hypothetical protein